MRCLNVLYRVLQDVSGDLWRFASGFIRGCGRVSVGDKIAWCTADIGFKQGCQYIVFYFYCVDYVWNNTLTGWLQNDSGSYPVFGCAVVGGEAGR